VYFPAAGEPATRGETGKEPEAEAAPAEAAPDFLKGCSILVLDDEESICMLLEEGLSAHGLKVRCTTSPEAALALVPIQRFDVLICDVNLSVRGANVNGADIAQKLLEAAGEQKPGLILMTGDYAEESAADADGPSRLQKPFRISDVLALLRQVIALNPEGTPSRRN